MKRCVFSLFFLPALILGLFLVNLAFSQEEGGKEGISAESAACFATLNNGAGANTFNICISNHGNLMQFTSPAGFDHINAEGYALCDSGVVDGWDAGFSEAGCGAQTIAQPNGANTLPLTITRNCDCFQFKQVFARDTVEKDVTITMTLKNICPFQLVNAFLSRYFDGDINGDPGDDIYDRTADSVSGRDINGLLLTAVTFATSHSTAVETFGSWTPGGTATGCSAAAVGTPAGPADLVGRVTYNLGTFNVNQSKTVKVRYGRE